MTSQQLTALAIKILAIWLLVNVVLYLPNIALIAFGVSPLSEAPIPLSISVAVLSGFIVTGLALSLIMLRMAKSILSSVPESREQIAFTPSVALQLTGLFFLVSALTVLPGYFLSQIKLSTIPMSSYGYMAGYIFKMAVGIYLLVKPSVWAGWFNYLRGSG